MTGEGYNALDEELRRLKTQERPSVIAAIGEARAHGDLSENAEYHAAKDRQGWIEGRIAEIEDKIARAQVIDVSKLSGAQLLCAPARTSQCWPLGVTRAVRGSTCAVGRARW